jgi:DNA-binding CsgD family transcriptional regulator
MGATMGKTQLNVQGNQLVDLSAIGPSSTSQTLLAVFQTSSFGLAILDRSLRYVGVNPALAAMNGLPAAAHPGKEISDVLGKAAPSLAPLLERVFASGQPLRGIALSAKLPLRPKMGHWVEDYLPLADSRGRVTMVVVLVAEVNQWWPMFGEPTLPPSGAITPGELSPREAEIVRLLAEGKSNKQVSSLLDISVKTVETHRARVMLKLHLDSLVGLVHYAIRNRLVEIVE